MTFHISYAFPPEARAETQERFKKTGAPPPANVKMVGRWHCTEGLGGYLIAETDDPIALGKWIQEWTDLITFEVTPVLDDEQISEVIG